MSSLADLNDMEIEKTIRTNFQTLINFAKQFVPESKRPQTAILLKATAGMRLVSLAKSLKIMNAVRQQLSGKYSKRRCEQM